ncbi:hypothetical protein ACLKA6_015071 [Drosophila palustris]
MYPRLNLFGRDGQQEQQQQQQQQQSPRRVLFMTRKPDASPEQEQEQAQRQRQEPIIVIIDDATLKKFVRCVYIIALIFILVTSITWLAFSWTEFNFYGAVPVPYYVWILVAFLLLMILNCVPKTRYIFPLNWGITIVIVILYIFAGACLFCQNDVLILLGILFGVLAIVAVFYAFGAKCPQKLLPGVLCTAVLSCLLIVLLLVFIIVMIFLKNAIIGLVSAITLLCLIILMMLFHAQYIHGRLQIVPLFDMLHCSLFIYLHFALLVYAIHQLVKYQSLV